MLLWSPMFSCSIEFSYVNIVHLLHLHIVHVTRNPRSGSSQRSILFGGIYISMLMGF